MLSPIKLVTGAAIAALGGTMLLAGSFVTQDDDGPAAPAIESDTSGVTLVTGEVAITSEDYPGHTEAHDWGYLITDSLQTAQFSLTDERLSGTARFRGNAHANEWQFVWSNSVYLENDGGSWVGSGTGYIDPPSTGGALAAGPHMMLVLEGQGGYEGLTAILDLDAKDSESPIEVSGAITTIGLPEVPGPAPTDLGADSASEPWDLVWFSDSTGFYVADMWAEKIEQELGVEVRVHDHSKGALEAVEILESLDEPTPGYKRLGDTRDDVAEAEIIVMYGNPEDSGMASDVGDACVTTSTDPRDPPTRYAEEDFSPYGEVLDDIWERVLDLVGDRPVIVRAIDSYVPVIADWQLADVEAECTQAWEAYSDTIQNAAAAFGVPTVSIYDAFNGSDHSEDPREKGFIISDGEHTSPSGREAMVEALDEAGYEPLYP